MIAETKKRSSGQWSPFSLRGEEGAHLFNRACRRKMQKISRARRRPWLLSEQSPSLLLVRCVTMH